MSIHALHQYCILDLETAPDDTALPYLRPVKADGRLTDEAKIAADLARLRLSVRGEWFSGPFLLDLADRIEKHVAGLDDALTPRPTPPQEQRP